MQKDDDLGTERLKFNRFWHCRSGWRRDMLAPDTTPNGSTLPDATSRPVSSPVSLFLRYISNNFFADNSLQQIMTHQLLWTFPRDFAFFLDTREYDPWIMIESRPAVCTRILDYPKNMTSCSWIRRYCVFPVLGCRCNCCGSGHGLLRYCKAPTSHGSMGWVVPSGMLAVRQSKCCCSAFWRSRSRGRHQQRIQSAR